MAVRPLEPESKFGLNTDVSATRLETMFWPLTTGIQGDFKVGKSSVERCGDLVGLLPRIYLPRGIAARTDTIRV